MDDVVLVWAIDQVGHADRRTGKQNPNGVQSTEKYGNENISVHLAHLVRENARRLAESHQPLEN